MKALVDKGFCLVYSDIEHHTFKNNLLFARVQKGSAPVWGSTVWNQTSDQVTRLGGTFVTTGYSDEIMLGSWQ